MTSAALLPRATVAGVVVSWNSRPDLPACLRSLESSPPISEIVVVDNASDDGSAAFVRASFPAVRVIEAGTNLGFGAASNLGWRATRAPFVLFLNPDAEVAPGAVASLLAVLERRPEAGIAGPATRNADGTPQVSFGPDLSLRSEWRQRRLVRAVRRRDPRALARAEELCAHAQEPAWVSGSCLLVRRTLLESLSGFDERFFLYEEDVDLCRRARKAGARVVYHPQALVVHRQGGSMQAAPFRARLDYDRSHLAYYEKHQEAAAAWTIRLLLLARGAAQLVAAAARGDAAALRAARARLRLGLLGL